MVQLAASRRQTKQQQQTSNNSDGWSFRLFQLSSRRSSSPNKHRTIDNCSKSEPTLSLEQRDEANLLLANDQLASPTKKGLAQRLRKDSLLFESLSFDENNSSNNNRSKGFQRFDSTDSILDSTASLNSVVTTITEENSVAAEDEDHTKDHHHQHSNGVGHKDANQECLGLEEEAMQPFKLKSILKTKASTTSSKRNHHRVGFDSVTVHYHLFALAKPDVIPVHFRVGDGPFLMTGSWFETREFDSLDEYNTYCSQNTRRSGSSSRLLRTKEGNINGEKTMTKKKLLPLRVYARERVLQKCGVSVREMDETSAEFSKLRTQLKDPKSAASKGGGGNGFNKKNKKWSFL